MIQKRQMNLGLSLRSAGYHPVGWRHPDAPEDPDTDINYYIHLAQLAERGKLDMVFLADGVAIRQGIDTPGIGGQSSLCGLEPLTTLSAIAMKTNKIGLVCTASTTYNEPYHIARKFASLDFISGGRACWNAVTSWTDEEAQNFGKEKKLDNHTRYARAQEFLKVVRGLWQTWEDDALIRDKAAGIYVDPSKIHALDHSGTHFKVRGPLNVPKSPQGRPLICQAGASDVGQEMAAETADFVYCVAGDLKSAQAYYKSIKGKLAKYGRAPETLKVLPGTTTFVGRTEKEAQEKYDYLSSLISPELGLATLRIYFGDLTGRDIDGPLPEEVVNADISIARKLHAVAKERNFSIRQLYTFMASGGERNLIIGSAEQIADRMEEWFVNDAADGFNLTFPNLPGGLEDFVELVVPILQERGLFRQEYSGDMLRDHVGG